ncbi:MAG: outer membrane beta-barrel protein [Chloroflexia bacterium]|nr:outer membrane beta-barrel protein [Chloroflexia bacterium]
MGFNYHIDTSKTIGFDVRYGYGKFQGISEFEYFQNIEPGSVYLETNSYDNSIREGSFFSLNLQYSHNFAKAGHKLNILGNLSLRNGDESHLNRLTDAENTILAAQYSTESGPSKEWRVQADYTLPLRGKDKFEAGFQSRTGNSIDETGLSLYDQLSGNFELQPGYSNKTDYNRTIRINLFTVCRRN